MNILAIIPARGGSKGIPKKNVRLMAGQPLISYSIKVAQSSSFNIEVVVSTDDSEISNIAKKFGANVIARPKELSTDSVTLDPVIYHAVNEIEVQNNKIFDIVITMQPTSPLLTVDTLDAALQYFTSQNLDTLISGVNKPHLSWTEKEGDIVPNYEKRLNRQYLPKNLMETGAFVITKRTCIENGNRIGPRVSIFEVPEKESIDIDTAQDWWIAEKEFNKKNILIHVEGYTEIGLGHIYRGLLLAYNLIDHNVKFVLSSKSNLGIQKIRESHFPYEIIEKEEDLINVIDTFNCDILINDILDTTVNYMRLVKSKNIKVINFEDLGEGATLADAVINDLYEQKNSLENHYWGSDYYCLRDEFLIAQPANFNEKVKEILIIFGGTDPSNLTLKVAKAFTQLKTKDVHITIILGLGYTQEKELQSLINNFNLNADVIRDVKYMTEYMAKADLAISSQGRTMLELAAMNVPTILMAQNIRELNHEFGYLENGFINLGLGSEVEETTINETLTWLLNSPQIRRQMKNQMSKKDLKLGIKRVLNIIID